MSCCGSSIKLLTATLPRTLACWSPLPRIARPFTASSRGSQLPEGPFAAKACGPFLLVGPASRSPVPTALRHAAVAGTRRPSARWSPNLDGAGIFRTVGRTDSRHWQCRPAGAVRPGVISGPVADTAPAFFPDYRRILTKDADGKVIRQELTVGAADEYATIKDSGMADAAWPRLEDPRRQCRLSVLGPVSSARCPRRSGLRRRRPGRK